MICSFAFATCLIAQSTSSPSPACSNPNTNAIAVKPVPPDYPDSAVRLGLGPVTTLALVTVGIDGKPTDIRIYKSSGNADVDAATITAAQKSTYRPRVIDCKPVAGGHYLFRADFNP